MIWSEADILLISGGQLITQTTVEGTLYGFASVLYIFCCRSLYLQLEDRDWRRHHLFTIVYMSLIMALALTDLAMDAQDALTSYVHHADYPGGGYGYSVDVFRKSPVGIVGYVACYLIFLMTSGIQIWRLWIVWRASRYSFLITVLPALTFFTGMGLGVASIVVITRSELSPPLQKLFYYGPFTLTLCTSITVTVPIIARILAARRRHVKIMGQTDSSGPYIAVISMLIESFALESFWLIVQLLLGFSESSNPAIFAVVTFFMDTQPFVQVLAYLLVVYRVASGRAWKEDTGEKLTSLRWNRDELQTTQIGTRSRIPITYEEG